MKKKENPQPDIKDNENDTVPAFSYELLREVLIPELLGKEQTAILYWSGRNMARKYPLTSIDEIIHFFHKAGWGDLSVRHRNKSNITFTLHSPLIAKRLQRQKETCFTLESGFLAQQIESIESCPTDAQHWIKQEQIIITAQWDQKDAPHHHLPVHPAPPVR